MGSTSEVQIFTLGDLAAAKGKLGAAHSRATNGQMATATTILTDPASYGSVGTTVICVEDRLHRFDPRLAGGALSLALMYNFMHGGTRLSQDLLELKARGFHLALHADCGALGLVAKDFVATELTNVNAEGYKLLASMGIKVPMAVRERIAAWARNLPAGYADVEAAQKAVDEIDQITGQHNAVFAAVSARNGRSFTGGPRLKAATNGLLSFAFDPWVAKPNAQRMGGTSDDQAVAETLALVFTAQVFLALGGPDLKVALLG